MYQALYRKWRPKTFDEVIGQQHITETLKNQVSSGRLSHAYLFIGSRGTGKTTCARILASAVNCEHPVNGNPCGTCPSCRGLLDGTILDVAELDAASNNGVDNVRALREEALFTPTTVKKRVYIIDEVHMLSTAAFNALLKILEEPPAHLMFILATTELQKVPATILSRCQRHSFRRINSETLTEYLGTVAATEHIALSQEAAGLIARLAEGGVRDALSLLDQCSAAETIDVDTVYRTVGLAGNRRVAEMLSGILAHDAASVLSSFQGMWMDGKNPASLLDELNSLLRDVLMLRVAPKGSLDLLSGAYETQTLRGFARQLTNEELLCAMQTVQRYQSAIRDAGKPKVQAELCLISLCEGAAGESVSALRARISRLEEDMAHGVPLRAEPACAPGGDEEDDRRRPDPEEDELDLSAFQEEQPEDAFLEKSASPAAPSAPQASYRDVVEAVKGSLPRPLCFDIEDAGKIRGSVEGSVLTLEVLPGFLYNLMNRQDVLSRFSEAARRVFGQEMRVQLIPMREQQQCERTLEALRSFPEVHFV